jgi:tetratricopeptide (TPR) repeat protein
MRAGKPARALELFERAGAAPEARHGRAQCLEKLGRYAEALAAYDQVAAASDAGPWAARAAEDREFLAWKLELERAVAARRNGR